MVMENEIRLPVHIHGRTMHGLRHVLEYAGLAA